MEFQKYPKEEGTQRASQINSFKSFKTFSHSDRYHYTAVILLTITIIITATTLSIITTIISYSTRDQFSCETNEHQAREVNGKAKDRN